MAAAEMFQEAGQATGLELWRIERLKPVRVWPGVKQVEQLELYTGDSYILLNTFDKGGDKVHHLHFWLGEDSSQDERGAAALLTVQLDQEVLGNAAVQYREVQGSESGEFLQAASRGVVYRAGGVASGFKHVEGREQETALFHVKGRRNVRIAQVPAQVTSLNSGDCFVLSAAGSVFSWSGTESLRQERLHAAQFALSLQADAAVKAKHLEEADRSSAPAQAFFAALGASDAAAAKVAPASAGGSDDAAGDNLLFAAPALYRPAGSGSGFEEVQARPLSRSMLGDGEVTLLHAGGSIWVWQSKGSGSSEALDLGQKLAAELKLGAAVPVKVVKPHLEPLLFKQYFANWDAAPPAAQPGLAPDVLGADADAPAEPDLDSVVQGGTATPRSTAHSIPRPDAGSAQLTVWRVEDFELVEWPASRHGSFFAGDSFVLRYQYRQGGALRGFVCFWLGRDSSSDECGAAAMLAAKLKADHPSDPLVRVVQEKEPAFFLAMFEGPLVVHSGGRRGGWKNLSEADSYDTDGCYLYQIRARGADLAYAVQLKEESAAKLNSGDSFILVSGTQLWQWNGKGAGPAERAAAEKLADRLAAGTAVAGRTTLEEGAEEVAFWQALGGKADYPQLSPQASARPPRLFQLSDVNTGGRSLSVEEVVDFSQDDLDDNDVMLLDTHEQVFVWLGAHASAGERDGAMDIARRFVESASRVDGRDLGCPIVALEAGSEPPMFTCHFVGWDSDRTRQPSIEERLAAMKAAAPAPAASAEEKALESLAQGKAERARAQLGQNGVGAEEHGSSSRQDAGEAAVTAAPAAGAAAAAGEETPEGFVRGPNGRLIKLSLRPGVDVVAYEQLREMTVDQGIDSTCKEAYLSDVEFQQVFKVPRASFQKLPLWRQRHAKKEAGLF